MLHTRQTKMLAHLTPLDTHNDGGVEERGKKESTHTQSCPVSPSACSVQPHALDIRTWYKRLNVRENEYSSEQMREIVATYVIGTVLQDLHPNVKVPTVSNLTLLVVGLQRSGKSSFVVTTLTALEKQSVQSVQWWRSSVANSEYNDQAPNTLLLNTYTVRMGGEHTLELVDIRGFTDDDNAPSATTLNSKRVVSDDEYVEKFRNTIQSTTKKFHAAIVVVPANLQAASATALIQLRGIVEKAEIPVVHVFTKCDLQDANVKKTINMLGKLPEQVLTVASYSAANHKYNETINYHALTALLWTIRLADGEGLRLVARKEQLQEVVVIQRQRVEKKSMYSTTEKALMFVIVIIVVMLYAQGNPGVGSLNWDTKTIGKWLGKRFKFM